MERVNANHQRTGTGKVVKGNYIPKDAWTIYKHEHFVQLKVQKQ